MKYVALFVVAACASSPSPEDQLNELIRHGHDLRRPFHLSAKPPADGLDQLHGRRFGEPPRCNALRTRQQVRV
jgi:hypothetical protein